jgi:hypothetical protein
MGRGDATGATGTTGRGQAGRQDRAVRGQTKHPCCKAVRLGGPSPGRPHLPEICCLTLAAVGCLPLAGQPAARPDPRRLGARRRPTVKAGRQAIPKGRAAAVTGSRDQDSGGPGCVTSMCPRGAAERQLPWSATCDLRCRSGGGTQRHLPVRFCSARFRLAQVVDQRACRSLDPSRFGSDRPGSVRLLASLLADPRIRGPPGFLVRRT